MMFCENCGGKLAAGAVFCENCGASVQSTTAAQPQRQAYAAPVNTGYQSGQREITMGDWMITLFVSAIPIIGAIMMLVWAFGSGTPTSKRNFARAVLVYAIIGIIVSVIFSTLISGLIQSQLSSMY